MTKKIYLEALKSVVGRSILHYCYVHLYFKGWFSLNVLKLTLQRSEALRQFLSLTTNIKFFKKFQKFQIKCEHFFVIR